MAAPCLSTPRAQQKKRTAFWPLVLSGRGSRNANLSLRSFKPLGLNNSATGNSRFPTPSQVRFLRPPNMKSPSPKGDELSMQGIVEDVRTRIRQSKGFYVPDLKCTV